MSINHNVEQSKFGYTASSQSMKGWLKVISCPQIVLPLLLAPNSVAMLKSAMLKTGHWLEKQLTDVAFGGAQSILFVQVDAETPEADQLCKENNGPHAISMQSVCNSMQSARNQYAISRNNPTNDTSESTSESLSA